MALYPVLNVTPETAAQDVFNAVVKHLAAQKRPAMLEGGTCVNRTTDGRACAVACLLTDVQAGQLAKGWRNAGPTAKGLYASELAQFDGLLRSLQSAHDGHHTPEGLKSVLIGIAERAGLDFSVVDLITEWET